MSDVRMESSDSINPVRIVHNCEELWEGKKLIQCYNYIEYEFETEVHRYRARSYLQKNASVAIYGPFNKDEDGRAVVASVEIDSRVLSYLRRRFAKIEKLGKSGYTTIR